MPSKYDEETRAKAVRLVVDHRSEYPSEWKAILAVSSRLGMTAETLRNWSVNGRSMTANATGSAPKQPPRSRR